MTRVVIFLVAIGLLAVGVAWPADPSANIAITWQGWRIETSMAVLAIAVGALMMLAVAMWSLVRALGARPVVRRPPQ
jgi:HemY protein